MNAILGRLRIDAILPARGVAKGMLDVMGYAAIALLFLVYGAISGLDDTRVYDIEAMGDRGGTTDRGTYSRIGTDVRNQINDTNTSTVATWGKVKSLSGQIVLYVATGRTPAWQRAATAISTPSQSASTPFRRPLPAPRPPMPLRPRAR